MLPAVVASDKRTKARKPFGRGKLYREVAYLHRDEMEALAERADWERCSKAEVIRRALRDYLQLAE